MRSALPFVVLYDTEFILDTNAIDCYHKFDHQPRRGKPRRESRVDREERLVFVRRLPANRPFTGGFSFRFKKIKIAIDFSRRFAIIILPSAPKRGSHGRCAWTGVERMAFRVGPPLNRSSLRAVFLCSETSHCFVMAP